MKPRIIIHDYDRHPFQIRRSRHVAQQVIETHHLYSTLTATLQADLCVKLDDTKTFYAQPISLGATVEKYNPASNAEPFPISAPKAAFFNRSAS